jgi:hypothetical protein
MFRHTTVYHDPRFFAGWPANHGAWQGDQEFLVGFMRGPYTQHGAMHAIGQPFEKLLARSVDQGETWRVEFPNVNFECVFHPNDYAPAIERVPNLDGWPEVIYRVCGVYDTGGEDCDPKGGYYRSTDYGQHWDGPWPFLGLDLPSGLIFTGRTCVLGDLWFVSKGHENVWGCDDTFVLRQRPNNTFELWGEVCNDNARAVMPAVTVLPTGEWLCALRRRKTARRDGWVDTFISRDRGQTWQFHSYVGSTGSYNGNPPALRTLRDGRVLCCYGNRDEGAMVAALFSNNKWESFAFRTGGNSDIGYPRLFERTDGTPVCVYYWTTSKQLMASIEATHLEGL